MCALGLAGADVTVVERGKGAAGAPHGNAGWKVPSYSPLVHNTGRYLTDALWWR